MRHAVFNLYDDLGAGCYDLISEIQELGRSLDCKIHMYISTDQRYLKDIYSRNSNIVPTRFEKMPIESPQIGNYDGDVSIKQVLQASYGYWVNAVKISQALVEGAKYQIAYTGLTSHADLTGFSELFKQDIEANLLYVNGLSKTYPYYFLPSNSNLISDPSTAIKMSMMWKNVSYWNLPHHAWRFFNFRFENFDVTDDQFGAYLWYAWLNNQAIKLRIMPEDDPNSTYGRKTKLFNGPYEGWRAKRLHKLVTILGKEWFKGKRILELGAGHGHIGNALQSLGAEVTCTEGREDHIQHIRSLYPNLRVLHLDQDKPWNLNERFDLVIHWGVLYHLDNWEEDLKSALNHAPMMALETEVADSSDPTFQIKVPEEGFDQALNGVGSRPSTGFIESFLVKADTIYTRYDHAELNSGPHKYDWIPKNNDTWNIGQRRYWIINR